MSQERAIEAVHAELPYLLSYLTAEGEDAAIREIIRIAAPFIESEALHAASREMRGQGVKSYQAISVARWLETLGYRAGAGT